MLVTVKDDFWGVRAGQLSRAPSLKGLQMYFVILQKMNSTQFLIKGSLMWKKAMLYACFNFVVFFIVFFPDI
jgi:hypothetical protein